MISKKTVSTEEDKFHIGGDIIYVDDRTRVLNHFDTFGIFDQWGDIHPHVHTIIRDVADNFMLRLQEKQGTLEINLEAPNDLIEGDEVHISNLINNLMDNAVKYSKENVPPRI